MPKATRRSSRRTPKRAGQRPPAGSRFPSEVLADNLRAYRRLADLTQGELGERMADLFGHEWSEQTAGFVERGDRTVTTDELVALALALDVTIADLLDPAGPTESRDEGFYVGEVGYGKAQYLPGPVAQIVARSISRAKLEETKKGAAAITVPVTPQTSPYLGRLKEES